MSTDDVPKSAVTTTTVKAHEMKPGDRLWRHGKVMTVRWVEPNVPMPGMIRLHTTQGLPYSVSTFRDSAIERIVETGDNDVHN